MKLNERSIPNRVENVAVGVHASFDVCRSVWTRISESDPVAGSGRAKARTWQDEVSQASELKRQRDPR